MTVVNFQASSASSAALHGKGVFTTVGLDEGQPFLWEKHWRRLMDNAAKLEIDVSAFNEEATLEELKKEIRITGFTDGRARITFSDESPSEIWSERSEKRTRLSIITAPRRELPTEISLTVSPHRINTTSALVGIKSCNYLEHLMAYKEAKGRGFDEAIRVNERGEVASACMANIFWLKGERLYTPSLETGCLPGTTREFVLENLDCEEIKAPIGEMEDANAIFLTSAGIWIVGVSRFDRTPKGTSRHPILDLLTTTAEPPT